MRSFLIEARKKKGMTQQEVANAATISHTSYCNIENGRRNPSVIVARKLGAVLGIPWTKFFDESK